MIIRTNTSSLRVYNAGRSTRNALSKNLEKLSSGYRVNRAADDAAGLAVSERIRGKVTELDRCQSNASEGLDLARTADAALQEINDILKRARGLCIQAENGTYGDQELAAISGEMNQLFGEIDRITAGSYHNTICLFRGDIGQTYHDVYDEHFNALGPDQLQLWGKMDFVVGKQFDEAADAVPAAAAFELDDDVDPSNPDTLEGRALTIAGRTYYFTKGASTPPDVTTYRVTIGGTMEQTLQNLVDTVNRNSNPPYLSSASIDGRTVTLTARLRNLSYTLYGIQDAAPNGDAEWVHGTPVQSPAGRETLNAVDGTDASDNRPVYDTSVVLEYTFGSGGTVKKGNISEDDLKNLKVNTLLLYKNHSTVLNLQLKNILTPSVKTWEQFGAALAGKINALSGYTASYSNDKLTVNHTATSTSGETELQIYIDNGILEPAKPGTPGTGGEPAKELASWQSTGIDFKVQQTQAEGPEAREICTVEIPSLSGKFPCSFSVNGYTHLYYNPNDPTYTAYTSPSDVSLKTTANNPHPVASITAEQVANNIRSIVQNALGGSGNVTVTVKGGKLEIVAEKKGLNILNRLNSMFRAAQCKIYAEKAAVPSTGGTPSKPAVYSKYVIPDKYSNPQKRTITFDLGADVKDLEGKGFSIRPSSSSYETKIEFINSDNVGSLRDDYDKDIDLKNCSSHEEVRAAVEAALKSTAYYGSSYTVTLDGTKLKISRNGTISATDGILGMKQLSKSGQVRFEGGVNTGYSQTAIDFSSINEDNLDTLLGKGFRINCATCSGEYINVFFCWTNDGSVPPAFEREDPVTGAIRTIHNIPVELSKVTSGDRIVESIVKQVQPSLNHYTWVDVGDPPTTLLAMEKRPGDYVYDNKLWLGSIETGVEANFTYSVAHKQVPDLPKGDLDELETASVNIYVGSDPEPQIIPIHLPYIDLYHLRLCPPESGVDLTAEDQDPADWLGRIDRADLAVSSARGTIGADYNRLEHAIQDLSNAHIQLSDAYSVIRDADMAELMKNQMKLQILMQAQHSMQAQANQTPQGVLQLMQ